MATSLPPNWGNIVAGMQPQYPNYLSPVSSAVIPHYTVPIPVPTGRRFFVGDRGSSSSGRNHRVPVIDRKLEELNKRSDFRSLSDGMNFYFVHADVAIDVLGSYNPMYSRRPKKLAMMMLNVLPSPARSDWSLQGCGLAYPVPGLIGVRGARMRLSAAGLALLDHWCEKFPDFAPFMAPYDSEKAREVIMSDCYDLTIGHRPSAWREIDKLNEVYKIKAEAREEKRRRKEMEKQLMIYQEQELYRSAAYNYANATSASARQQLAGTSYPLVSKLNKLIGGS